MKLGARQVEAAGLPAFGQCRQCRAAGITQPQELCTLVESFAGGVIDRFAQQRVSTDAVDLHQLGMAARDQQGDKGEGRRIGRQHR